MNFITAKWENLILINYKINPDILKPYIPKGTEIDLYNNTCYISLVGFMFKDTKALGVKLPFHINFEEVNLRFYVKHNNKRGVVFIKEIVPKPLITFIANSIYKEHYQTNKMKHSWTEDNYYKHFEYKWKLNNKWESISVKTEKHPTNIPENSLEQFIAEHYFGYAKHGEKTIEYKIEHPTWKQLNVIDFKVDVNFENNYGSHFKFLDRINPKSVILAEGSEVSVKSKKTIQN